MAVLTVSPQVTSRDLSQAIMPKKGGKKKNKGGPKATVAAAVDKVADTAKNVVYVILPRKGLLLAARRSAKSV